MAERGAKFLLTWNILGEKSSFQYLGIGRKCCTFRRNHTCLPSKQAWALLFTLPDIQCSLSENKGLHLILVIAGARSIWYSVTNIGKGSDSRGYHGIMVMDDDPQ